MELTYQDYEELKAQCYGTDGYNMYSGAFGNGFLITDGVALFAKKFSAFWLLDMLYSYLPQIRKENDNFFVVTVTVNKTGTFEVVREVYNEETGDSENKTVCKQSRFYTDLPKTPKGKPYKFYFIDNVLLLTSEY